MKVIYAKRAQNDLETILGRLEAISLDGANSVASRIERAIRVLELNPGSGRMHREKDRVRMFPVGRHPYVIYHSHRAR
jgi:plasmid stabilization system protein ParE